MIFTASNGTWAKVTTTSIVALFVTLALTEFLDDEAAPSTVILIMPFVLLFGVGISYLSSVRHYEITDSALLSTNRLAKLFSKKPTLHRRL